MINFTQKRNKILVNNIENPLLILSETSYIVNTNLNDQLYISSGAKIFSINDSSLIKFLSGSYTYYTKNTQGNKIIIKRSLSDDADVEISVDDKMLNIKPDAIIKDKYTDDEIRSHKELIREKCKDEILIKISAHGDNYSTDIYDSNGNVIDPVFIAEIFEKLNLKKCKIRLIFSICFSGMCSQDSNSSIADHIHGKLKKLGYKIISSEGSPGILTCPLDKTDYITIVYKMDKFFIPVEDLKISEAVFPWFYYYTIGKFNSKIKYSGKKFSILSDLVQNEKDKKFVEYRNNIITTVEKYFNILYVNTKYIEELVEKNALIGIEIKYPDIGDIFADPFFTVDAEIFNDIEKLFEIMEDNWLLLLEHLGSPLLEKYKKSVEYRRNSNLTETICYKLVMKTSQKINDFIKILKTGKYDITEMMKQYKIINNISIGKIFKVCDENLDKLTYKLMIVLINCKETIGEFIKNYCTEKNYTFKNIKECLKIINEE